MRTYDACSRHSATTSKTRRRETPAGSIGLRGLIEATSTGRRHRDSGLPAPPSSTTCTTCPRPRPAASRP
jgi:hypothetical protein